MCRPAVWARVRETLLCYGRNEQRHLRRFETVAGAPRRTTGQRRAELLLDFFRRGPRRKTCAGFFQGFEQRTRTQEALQRRRYGPDKQRLSAEGFALKSQRRQGWEHTL